MRNWIWNNKGQSLNGKHPLSKRKAMPIFSLKTPLKKENQITMTDKTVKSSEYEPYLLQNSLQ